MTAPRPKTSWVAKAVLSFVLLGVGILGWIGFQQMRESRDYSAHAALSAEILSNLTVIAYDKRRFPDTLSDLPLRFPDGGDASLLRRFEYSSSGTSCTLRTRLPYTEKDSVWSF
jgi:hypothetical protein